MSLQKSNLNKILFVLLLILNVCLLLKMKSLIDRNSFISSEVYSISADAQSSKAEFDTYLTNVSLFNDSVIKRLLKELYIDISNFENKTILFIPPYPCGVCVDNEVNFIKNTKYDDVFSIIVPEYRYGDIRIQLLDTNNIRIVTYSWNESQDIQGIPLNQLIYFKVNNNIIHDIFLPNPNREDMSYRYFEMK